MGGEASHVGNARHSAFQRARRRAASAQRSATCGAVMQTARSVTVVTARSDQVDFKLPILQGMLVEVIARVVGVGHSSMKVDVDLEVENLLTGERQLGTRGHFVMVALDEHRQPVAVQPLPPA